MVLNIRLNGRGSVRSLDPHAGHFPSVDWSYLNLFLQFLQSTKGSEKVSSWPEYLIHAYLLKLMHQVLQRQFSIIDH